MKKIFALVLGLSLFLLCSCQAKSDNNQEEASPLAYDGPYVDLITAAAHTSENGDFSIIKVDAETGWPIAPAISVKNGEEALLKRVYPCFDHEGTWTQLRFENGVLTGARASELPLEEQLDEGSWETDQNVLSDILSDYTAQIAALS